ncbi:MAG: dihydropteroate synthase [Bacteroidetes bacterium]|nr:MAG: dihydropteroate synthase [Bacteroidota bacterium]
MISVHSTLRFRDGRVLSLDVPAVIGILNVTPDSFYAGGRHWDSAVWMRAAERHLEEGAALLDIGGMSSRPGAEPVSEEEELRRVVPVVEALHARFPEALLSVDTFRSRVAREAVSAGACMVNDISGGNLDASLFETVAELQVPYVLMHMRGTPQTMQTLTHYEDLIAELLDYFIERVGRLRALGVKDIVLDPGFGFAKNPAQNFHLLRNLHALQIVGLPLLVGLSRKSMIYKTLGITPEEALNGTTALHMVALQQGARLLRVHDVRPAMETVRLWQQLQA